MVLKNKQRGDDFEQIFESQARRNGLLAIKNNLTARYLPNGRTLITKSELDFKLINQLGRVGYFDCKSFMGDHFTFSQIDENQLKLAATYNYWFVPAGFVVWFRGVNKVAFFTGRLIERKGPKNRFYYSEGISLGSLHEFDLRLLLATKNNTVQTAFVSPILQPSS